MRKFTLFALIAALAVAEFAHAQAGTGSLRGYVRDESGAILPGATVTATSDAIMAPGSALSDGRGYYRIPNLPPGTYSITAELSGFAIHLQENIVLRAGSNFAVDIGLSISAVEETVTVTAETPMLEIRSPSNVLNVDGEFLRNMPIQARRNWSDFLELTPGVNARPFDDGSGKMVYFGHATEHFAHVIQLEGMIVSAYDDSQVTYIGMGADMIDDISVKTGGVTADEPMGTGIVMNVVTQSGGNDFSGSAGFGFQDFGMNGDNAIETGGVKGTPTTSEVKNFNTALGGPILRDKAWFFVSYRRADLKSGISRDPIDVERLQRYSGIPLGGSADTPARGTIPNFEIFPNESKSHQPYVKITTKLNPNHQMSAYYQRDSSKGSSDREFHWARFRLARTGGNLYGAKVTSLFGTETTGQFTFSYNNKRSEDPRDIQPLVGNIPLEIEVHESFRESGGKLRPDGRVVAGGSDDVSAENPSSYLLFRGDITHYKEGWGGSHEFKTGVFLAPRNRRRDILDYANFNGDGYFGEDHIPLDLNNLALGTRPFRRVRRDVGTIETIDARDRDIGLYFTDSWKPTERLTLSLGVRVDFVRRFDNISDFTRMDSTVVGPRVGFSYMLTKNARNVLRGSYGRVHEQVNGRDQVTTFTGSAGGSGGRSTRFEEFDQNGDGIFGDPPSDIDPASTGSIDPAVEFSSDLTQPYVDEFIGGYRTQLPGQLAIDVALVHRRYTKTYSIVDVNGFYPEPDVCCNPFIGFGRIDPNRGKIFQLQNNTWSKLVYTALEITVAKRMQNFQLMAGINRQWQHFAGTWNPTDPARFIQPERFASNKALWMPRGLRDESTLRSSNDLSYNPTWRQFSIRVGGTWRAPGDIVVGASFTSNAGPWSGALIDKLSSSDPEVTQFGPKKIILADGSNQSNPLATVYRLVGEDRGSGCELTTLPDNGTFCDGQARLPAVNTLGLNVGKVFHFATTQEFEVTASIFNVFNSSKHHQFTYSFANRVFSSNYAQQRNLQAAQALQLTFRWRF